MSFAFQEYRRPTVFDGLRENDLTDYITLPMPVNLMDNNNLQWNDKMPGGLFGEMFTRGWQDVSDAYAKEGVEGLVGAFNFNNLDKLGEGMTGYAVNKTIQGLRAAEGYVGAAGATDTGLQLLGLADNQFLTVGFTGPTYKRHHFQWMLSAKSRAESDVIRNIVNTFKKVAHPELLAVEAAGFWKYPNIVRMKFNPDSARQYLYSFKPCVITDVNIHYSAEGSVGFYASSNAPVNVILDIHFQEIELWRNGDGDQFIADGGIQLPTIAGGDFNDIQSPPVPPIGPRS
jgi:hypothetical protein